MAFYFIKSFDSKDGNKYDKAAIKFRMDSDLNIHEMISVFEDFLKACGYEIRTEEIQYIRKSNDRKS